MLVTNGHVVAQHRTSAVHVYVCGVVCVADVVVVCDMPDVAVLLLPPCPSLLAVPRCTTPLDALNGSHHRMRGAV